MHHAWLFSQMFAKQKISLSWLYLALKVLNLKTVNQKLLNVLSFLEYLQLLIFYHKCFLKQIITLYSKFIIKMSFLQSVTEQSIYLTMEMSKISG